MRWISTIVLVMTALLGYGQTDSLVVDSMMFNNIDTVVQHGPDWKRLGLHTGIFTGAGITMLFVLDMLPENATAWNKEENHNTPLFKRYKNHIKAGPVWDKDRFVFNYVLHPYAGAVYYTAARGAGCNWWQSFLYCTFISNVMWEYGFEAFNEIPSAQDLIITPVVGSVIGEGFHQARQRIYKNDRRVFGSRVLGIGLCWLMDPFNELGNVILGNNNMTSNMVIGKNICMVNVRYEF